MRHLEETYSLLWSWLKDGDDDDNGDGDDDGDDDDDDNGHGDELELPSLAICNFFLWS